MAEALAITTSKVNIEQIVGDKYNILHQELMHIRKLNLFCLHLNSCAACSMYMASADTSST